MPKSHLEPLSMTAPDEDLRALARYWRRRGGPEGATCAVQLEDALNARAHAERMALQVAARADALKLATMPLME